MRTFLKPILTSALLLAGGLGAHAFSLLGPFDTEYQTPELNYGRFTMTAEVGDLGGPMNRGEEYRAGSPVLVYAFDSTFTEFFGDAGVDAVETAVAELNALPLTTAMSPTLSEFRLNTTRFNVLAQQLQLMDVKSLALSLLLQQMGLACPERFTWTLHERRPIPNTDPVIFQYYVIQRNFDPVTGLASSYVNNTLYTYRMLRSDDPPWSDAQELSVDVANPNVSVAALAGLQAGFVDPRVRRQVYGPGQSVIGGFGLYFSGGITRDDAGAIRYLYRPDNVNWQSAPLGATGGGGGGGGGGSSPWSIVGFEVLNPDSESAWNVVGGGIFGFTNTVDGDTGVIVGNASPDGGRGGPGKVAFVRANFDPLLGRVAQNLTVRYPETIINAQGVAIQTVTQRVLTRPDILFTTEDLGTYVQADDPPQPYAYAVRNMAYAQVRNPGAGNTGPSAGPGIIEPGVDLVFNRVGPWYFNIGESAQEDGVRGFMWGSFDGSTNAPVVYPQSSYPGATTLGQLESILFP
ncbi:MAG: hypothetical protein KIT22_02585 [Verrucomicrobiae bacterium]|nr:hypothetical protein [Verrucomicrobiae bacterium]